MLALIQRVSTAQVDIGNQCYSKISNGLLILCGFKASDNLNSCLTLLERCFKYRIFADDNDKMNLSLLDIEAEALIVPQFTLVADTKSGLRPSFSKGLAPTAGKALFSEINQHLPARYERVQFGQFGADMQVQLCNDGPVTFLLEN